MDEVEKVYMAKITRASGEGDNDLAQELTTALREYRQIFKCEPADDGAE